MRGPLRASVQVALRHEFIGIVTFASDLRAQEDGQWRHIVSGDQSGITGEISNTKMAVAS